MTTLTNRHRHSEEAWEEWDLLCCTKGEFEPWFAAATEPVLGEPGNRGIIGIHAFCADALKSECVVHAMAGRCAFVNGQVGSRYTRKAERLLMHRARKEKERL